MIDGVVWESRHKFVYYDKDTKNQILDMISNYPAKLDSEEPIVVYIKDDGLPKIDNKLKLDKYRIRAFHNNYYDLLIFLSIIETLIKSIDREVLNNIFNRLFRMCSVISKTNIDDVLVIRDLVDDSKNIYKESYIKYMETGKLDFYDKLSFPFVMIDDVVECLKKDIGLKKYFSLLIDFNDDLSIYNQMAINSYIASRCNGYLSVNVLLDNYNWKYYYSSNGQLIEYVHDYTEVDLKKYKDKVKIRQS